MSIIRCSCCDENFDTDINDGSYSKDGEFLCEGCCDE